MADNNENKNSYEDALLYHLGVDSEEDENINEKVEEDVENLETENNYEDALMYHLGIEEDENINGKVDDNKNAVDEVAVISEVLGESETNFNDKILEDLEKFANYANEEFDRLGKEILSGNHVDSKEIDAILIGFDSKFSYIKNNDKFSGDLRVRVDENFSIIKENVEEFKKKNSELSTRKINQEEKDNNLQNVVNGSAIDVVNDYIRRIKLDKDDMIEVYADKQNKIDNFLSNLIESRNEFNNKEINETNLISTILDIRNRLISEFDFDLDNKASFKEQKKYMDSERDACAKIVVDVKNYFDVLDDNVAFILSDKNSGLSYEERNEEFTEIKNILKSIADNAEKRTKKSSDLRKELDDVVKEINNKYKVDVTNKDKKKKRRKVVSVKRASLGLVGTGIGAFGLYRVIISGVFFAKYGMAFVTGPNMAVTIGSVIVALLALKGAIHPSQRGIIEKCIEKLKMAKKRINNQSKEEQNNEFLEENNENEQKEQSGGKIR